MENPRELNGAAVPPALAEEMGAEAPENRQEAGLPPEEGTGRLAVRSCGGKTGRARLPAAVVLFALALLAYISLQADAPPKPLSLDAPLGEFSAARALRHVWAVSGEFHPLGSPAHERVKDYLLRTLRNQGFAPDVQEALVPDGPGLALTRVENILVRIPGAGAAGSVLLMAHYDSVSSSCGAGDDGAGVAAILETLRALKYGPRCHRDVVALLSDGEEEGLLGSRAFRDGHAWAKDIRFVVNLDSPGHAGPLHLYRCSPGNKKLMEAYARIAPHPGLAGLFEKLGSRPPWCTDFTTFLDNGLPGMDLGLHGGIWDYHTFADTPENLSARSLQQMGETALALVRHWAGPNSAPSTEREDALSFHVPGIGMLVLDYRMLRWLSILATVGLGAAVLIGARRRLFSWAELGVAGAAVVSSLLVGWALGGRCPGLLAHFFPDASSIVNWRHPFASSSHYNPGFLLGLIAVILLLSWGFWRLVVPRVSPLSLAVAGLAPWMVLSAWAVVFRPTLGYLFSLPLMAALSALFWTVLGRRGRASGGWRVAVVSLAGLVPALFLFLPLINQMVILRGFGSPNSAGIGIAAGLLFWIAVPVVSFLQERWPALLPLAISATILAGVAWGRAWDRDVLPRAVEPGIAYWVDGTAGRAWWVTERDEVRPGRWKAMEMPSPGDPLHRGKSPVRLWIHQAAPAAPLRSSTVEVSGVPDGAAQGVRMEIVPAEPLRQLKITGKTPAPAAVCLAGYKKPLRVSVFGDRWKVVLGNPDLRGVDLTLRWDPGAQVPDVFLEEVRLGLPLVPGFTTLGPSPGCLSANGDNITLIRRKVVSEP